MTKLQNILTLISNNKVKFIAFLLDLTSGIMGVDDKILHLPGVPAKVAMYWPLTIAIAGALHKWASTFNATYIPPPTVPSITPEQTKAANFGNYAGGENAPAQSAPEAKGGA